MSSIEGVGSAGLVVGAIESGIRADRAPNEAMLWIGRRFLPDGDPAKIRQAVSAIVGKAMTGRKGVQCRVRPILTDAALAASPQTRAIVAAILKAAKDTLDGRIPVRGSSLPTEARFFANVGIPAVSFGCGEGAATLGFADESILLDDVRSSTEMVALTVARLLASDPDSIF